MAIEVALDIALGNQAVVLEMAAEPELELVQAHMAQKPVLRVEVGARALRVRSVPRSGYKTAMQFVTNEMI